MDNIEELKADILAKVKWYPLWNPDDFGKTGGQTVSLSPRSVCLDSEETGFRIFIEASHSNLRNIELAIMLFKLYLDEVIK